MSDASVPSSMSTIPAPSHPLYGQLPGRQLERRRNTLGSTMMFQTPPPPSSAGMFPPTPPRPATSPQSAGNVLAAEECADSSHMLFLTPLTPPQSPTGARPFAPMQPSCQQQRRFNVVEKMLPPLATIPERCMDVNIEEASIGGSMPRPPPQGFTILTAAGSCEDLEYSQHIVLGSKKIRLARPRL
ncbi:hypothetical protein GGI21_006553, partial [Coemansia aciculifera]